MTYVRRALNTEAVTVVPAGDCACVVCLGNRIDRALHAQVLDLLRELDASPQSGLRELIPSYTSILIHYDPLATSFPAVEALARAALARPPQRTHQRGRVVRIPVRYGGEDGPDLAAVAQELGLSPDEVVRLHASADYRVYFLGFLAGFPYLGGLPASLAVSRLPTPRAHVVAGSVGIAGQQTGIYPVASPGGWRLIGRTPWPLFDPTADPPTLLRPGDRVRFASLAEGLGPALRTQPRKPSGATQAASARRVAAQADPTVPWLRVLRPGPLTTVQDLGRPGYARYGVSASGAADGDALRLGNALLSNPAGAAALEVTLGGVAVEALAPSALAVTGADCEIRVNGRVVPLNRVQLLAPGDGIELSVAQRGVRAYLCVAGGVAVPPLLGSRSTDMRAGLGGLEGRALRSGDLVHRGLADGASAALAGIAGRVLRGDTERRLPVDGEWRLRVTPGHHHANAPAILDRLLAARFTVDPRSDRVGVRLRWSERADTGEDAGGELLSEGVPRGAVQVPPDGEPIILLADHQTTGGYAVPAVVITADLWRVGQLRPGDSVRLVLVTPDAAIAALAAREAWLRAVAERWATGERVVSAEPGEVDVARLMGGFSEWSEEAGDDE